VDRARLRPEIAGLLNESHDGADRQLIEGATQNAVAVKVDKPAVVGLDPAKEPLVIYLANATFGHVFMHLDLPPDFALLVLQFAASGLEGVAQRHVHVFVGVIRGVTVVDREFMTRDGDPQGDVEQLALVVMAVRRLDCDVAMDDMRAELLEAPGELANARFQGRRGLHVTECDFQRQQQAQASF
jgi:hypothetical protein